MSHRLVSAAVEELSRHAHRLNSIVTMKGFDWKNLPTQQTYQSLLACLDDHKSNLVAHPTVKIVDPENYHEHYRKDGVAMLEMGFQRGLSYPLHDHPEMVVMSLVLSGKVRFTHLDIDMDLFHSSGKKSGGILSSMLGQKGTSMFSKAYPSLKVGQK